MKVAITDPRGCSSHPYAIRIGNECGMCRHERIEAESGTIRTIRANAGNPTGASYSAVRTARRKGRTV